jgi:tRNA(His) 5'-end guanylyltransferase
VVGRIDGKSFSTLTKGMNQPWDDDLMACMNAAAIAIAEEAQGCKVVYVQSDEINILLMDTDRQETQPWFGYETRKLCSIAAATATAAFCVEYSQRFPERWAALIESQGYGRLPRFDARFWNLPEHEVPNYFIWRQKDAIRNSKQMLGRAYFSHSQLNGKSSNEIVEMVLKEHGVNWLDFEFKYTIGSTYLRKEVTETVTWKDRKTGEEMSKEVQRKSWLEDSFYFDYGNFFEKVEYFRG